MLTAVNKLKTVVATPLRSMRLLPDPPFTVNEVTVLAATGVVVVVVEEVFKAVPLRVTLPLESAPMEIASFPLLVTLNAPVVALKTDDTLRQQRLSNRSM
jgi:hypothetical protein